MSVQPYSAWFTSFLILGIATCAVNRLFLNAEKSLLSRDWLVVISSDETLSSLNATFTALDQLTNVISPIIVGVWIIFYMKLLFYRFTINTFPKEIQRVEGSQNLGKIHIPLHLY
uniref:Solute carrier family 40 member n=1 Tax=Angiostrongylus cantonensis TaxID=6313 RepID=A0A0K0CYF1_ANGCA